MKGKISKLFNRITATILSLAMVISIIPGFKVHAETSEHPGFLTITVVDEGANPIVGATVDFTLSEAVVGEIVKDTLTTDENGTIEVLDTDLYDDEGSYILNATVSKDTYVSKTLTDYKIVDKTENVLITLSDSIIDGISIHETIMKYDGNEYPAATIEGLLDTDVVTYQLNDQFSQKEMPTIKEVGDYQLNITIQREGYKDTSIVVFPKIMKNDIILNVTEYIGDYDKVSHPALKVEGLVEGDIVTYKLNEENEQNSIPVITNVGNYTVTMQVERYGYNTYEKVFNSIKINSTEIEGLSAETYNGVYDESEHKAVLVNGTIEGDVVEYKVDEGEWSTEVPLIKDAGSYEIGVRVSRLNYEMTYIVLNPSTATIMKAEQSVIFDNYEQDKETTVKVDSNIESNKYDFSATMQKGAKTDIIYSITNASDDGKNIDDIAVIDSETGVLTVKSAGCIIVTASKAGDDNYNDSAISHNLVITDKSSVSFDKDVVDYVFGENNGVISSMTATKDHLDDNGQLSYSLVDNDDYGISINTKTGEVKIVDYNKLAEALINNNNQLTLTVKVNKGIGVKYPSWRNNYNREVYPAAEDTYTLNIKFAETPETPYLIEGEKGTIDTNETNWYVSNITVKATEGYEISKTADTFGSEVVFDNQGSDTRYVYLKNVNTGAITNRIAIDVNIDTVKPDANKMNVTFSEVGLIERIGELLGFYQPTVTITFTAEDIISGINHFDWKYEKTEGASNINASLLSGRLEVNVNGNIPTAELVLPEDEATQLNGKISFTATDNAGNVSDVKYGDDIIIIDTTHPKLSFSHQLLVPTNNYNEVNGQHYYSGGVKVTLDINEANFYSEGVEVVVTKDGQPYNIETKWNDLDVDNHQGIIELTEDGDYVVFVTYKDKSTNDMAPYQSDVITIDTTKPILGFVYDIEKQSVKYTVTEHNFRPEDITVQSTVTDIKGNPVITDDLTEELRSATWVQDSENPDMYTYETTTYVDGIYELTINYKDIAKNEAEEFKTDSFIVDHSKSKDVSISYSTPLLETVLDTVLEVITLGFYNPKKEKIEVTFTAYDDFVGVKSFTYDYTKQEGASNVNSDTDTEEVIARQTVDAVQDKQDKSKFTATITLPRVEEEQLRGTLAAFATDVYGNISDKVNDENNIIIVDTILPELSVEYKSSIEPRLDNEVAYYKDKVQVTLNVTEANFFAEDVRVSISKNGGGKYIVIPTWTLAENDDHIGTFTLSGDGDYKVYVEYTDRSNNEMIPYESHLITIDTINPVIKVEYKNDKVINTLKDNENNDRKYYDDTQEATITITEHNFVADEVDFKIVAKDVQGNELNVEELVSKTTWNSVGDEHHITITYPGDANYTFDVEYLDLANNELVNSENNDYAPDYFTVDKTLPKNLTVDYSTSILDTILESISFGFYNAKMTVTLHADDNISGVHSFMYSYINAENVSGVNQELKEQLITAEDITYSNNGLTATASFEIPKLVLENDNQFNGTVSFSATDRVDLVTEHKENKRVVVDNIAPTIEVTYNEPVHTENNISYYAGDINATLVITEANFYADDVKVMISKDGGAPYSITPNWTDNSLDVHTGTFTITGDGHYIVTVEYLDKSGNKMNTYTSNQLTIDTVIENPILTVNGADGNGKAFKDEVVPGISFTDENFADYEIILTRTTFAEKNVNVNSKFVDGHVSIDAKGGNASLNTFEKIAENDGIYTMTVKMTDKAGHSSEATMTFTVNRFGSVYEYEDYLVSLITNGGAYVKEVTDDLIITEYNADRLVSNSLVIEITCDGKPLNDVNYTVSPEINSNVSLGSSGWYQYRYTINKSNFASDGIYKISISSADATGNTPENNSFKDKEILFRVDASKPELTSVVGLEKSSVQAESLDVKYSVFDALGLKSITIYLNSKEYMKITDFSSDLNNYEGVFTINESTSRQKVQIVVEDLAGNITDTDAAEFESAYEFNNAVLVNPNFLIIWLNSPVFYVVVAAVGGAAWYFIRRNRRNEEEEQPQ